MKALATLARHGRWLLIAGLVAGVSLPGLAGYLTPAIVPFIAVMLCITTLREGPRAALPRPGRARRALITTLILQCAAPFVAGGVLWACGLLDTPLATGVVLALAGAPITGTPGLAVMSGADGGAALRMLIMGTALLPLTAVPVFVVLPVFPDPWAVISGALRLLAIIGISAGVALVLRARIPALTRPETRPALDGIMVLAMALIVIALMSAVAPAARDTPGQLAAAFALAWGLYLVQTFAAWRTARSALPRPEALSVAIAAGNRNLALFLAAVPPETAAPLMVFVGCYQIPMYLTPMLLPRLTDARR